MIRRFLDLQIILSYRRRFGLAAWIVPVRLSQQSFKKTASTSDDRDRKTDATDHSYFSSMLDLSFLKPGKVSDLKCVERTTHRARRNNNKVVTSYRVSDRDAFCKAIQGNSFHDIFNFLKGQVLWVSDTVFVVTKESYDFFDDDFRWNGHPDWPRGRSPMYYQHIRETGTPTVAPSSTIFVGAVGSGESYDHRCTTENIRMDYGYFLSLFRGLQTPVTLYLNFRGQLGRGVSAVKVDALMPFLECNNSVSLQLIEMHVEASIMECLLSIPFESLEFFDVNIPMEIATDQGRDFSGGPTSILLDGCGGDWVGKSDWRDVPDTALFGRCPRLNTLKIPDWCFHGNDLSFLAGTHIDKLELVLWDSIRFNLSLSAIHSEWQDLWKCVSTAPQITSIRVESGSKDYWHLATPADRMKMAEFLAKTLHGNNNLLDITGELDEILGETAFAGLISPILDRNRVGALRRRLKAVIQQNKDDESECRQLLVKELESEPTNTNISLLFTTLKEFLAGTAQTWKPFK